MRESLLKVNVLGIKTGNFQARKPSIGSIVSTAGRSAFSGASYLNRISDDKIKLRNLIRMCMNDDYAKANGENKERFMKRNKATFTKSNNTASTGGRSESQE